MKAVNELPAGWAVIGKDTGTLEGTGSLSLVHQEWVEDPSDEESWRTAASERGLPLWVDESITDPTDVLLTFVVKTEEAFGSPLFRVEDLEGFLRDRVKEFFEFGEQG